MSKLLQFMHSIFYMEQEVETMTPEQKKYYAIEEEKNTLINATTARIEETIERFCRVTSEITIDDMGFGYMTSQGYKNSWQSSVVKDLEDLGYRCLLVFKKEDGVCKSKIIISW